MLNDKDMQFTWASERHLRLSLGSTPSGQASARIDQALAAIQRARVPGLVDITPASTTLLLAFDCESLDEPLAVNAVRAALMDAAEASPPAPPAIIEIPVCYHGECAPDGYAVGRMHGLSMAELVRLHSKAEYRVEFIGFAPGFGYLSGLPERLNTPRLNTPRTRVPAGSVGIAGDMTGVYPGHTAGGWRLIGRTPLRMFDAGRAKPSLLARGDRVKFVPITLAEFEARIGDEPLDD